MIASVGLFGLRWVELFVLSSDLMMEERMCGGERVGRLLLRLPGGGSLIKLGLFLFMYTNYLVHHACGFLFTARSLVGCS